MNSSNICEHCCLGIWWCSSKHSTHPSDPKAVAVFISKPYTTKYPKKKKKKTTKLRLNNHKMKIWLRRRKPRKEFVSCSWYQWANDLANVEVALLALGYSCSCGAVIGLEPSDEEVFSRFACCRKATPCFGLIAIWWWPLQSNGNEGTRK